MSLLVWPALCTGQFVTRGRVLASLGKSHSCETPTTSSINPSAAAISVAAGTSETIRLTNDYISDSWNDSLPRVPIHQSVTTAIWGELEPFALRRYRGFPDREIAISRSVGRSRLGGSFGGPSRPHGRRELLTTFRREIEFPLLFLGGACSFCGY